MSKGPVCTSLEKFILRKLKLLNVDTTGLDKTMVIGIVSLLMTEKGYTLETIEKLLTVGNKRLLNDAIAREKNRKMQEKRALENNKIGNATLVIMREPAKKGDPRLNRDTLYIFPDNLQASNEVFGEEIGDTIKVKDGVKLNVNGSSAMFRTDINGDINENVVGINTKKNAQNENGTFIYEEGYFQDTDEDFEAFDKALTRSINRIKELLFSENSPYKKVAIVEGFTMDKAGLPERFVDRLQDVLEKELGIYTQKLLKKDGYYGLKVMELGKEEKQKKEKALKEADKKLDALKESLLKKAPELSPLDINFNDQSLLSKVYPNIEQRMARVQYISDEFSKRLTAYIDDVRKDYENRLDDLEDYEKDYYNGLISGTKAEQRVFALKHFTVDGEPLPIYIFNRIRNRFIEQSEFGATEKGIEDFVKVLLDETNPLGAEFCAELFTMDIKPFSERGNRFAHARARYLVGEYNKMKDIEIFDALCREAAFELAFNENIMLDLRSVDQISRDEKEEEDNPSIGKDSIDDNTDEEAKENTNKEGYMIKYKLLDPTKTLSIEIKTLLGSIYKRDVKNPSFYVFNDLGSRVRMDAFSAYRILQEEFCAMRNPDQFNSTLQKTIDKYSWLGDIKDILIYNDKNPKAFNKSLRNEFYTVMRKTQIPYFMVTSKGLLNALNRKSSSADILANAKANFEGRIVLAEKSIYTDTGEINIDNCIAIHRLFSTVYDKKEDTIVSGEDKKLRNEKKYRSFKRHPLGFAKNTLYKLYKENAKIEDVVNALNILAGFSEEHDGVLGKEGLSLNTVLKCIGIDTNYMDIDSLFGDWVFLSNEDTEKIQTLDELSVHITRDQAFNLYKILQFIETIVNTRGTDYIAVGDNLVTKFQSCYLGLGSRLTMVSNGYTTMTFRHGGSTRASYAAPDFISDLIEIVSKIDSEEDIEEATKYLEENYSRFDFFRDPKTKEWLNPWLEDLFDSSDNYENRKNFKYANILSFMGNEDINSFAKAPRSVLLQGIYFAYLNTTSDGRYAYYRGPLLSDVDSAVFFKGKRYTGEGYQDKVLDKLVKVLLQEINRINDLKGRNKSSIDIEYYNSGRKNGLKFQYFPELNSGMSEIMKIYKLKPNESAVSYKNRIRKEFKAILKELIDSKVEAFLADISDNTKIRIYRTIQNNNKKESNNTEEGERVNLLEDKKEEPLETNIKERARQVEHMNNSLTEFFYNDFLAQASIQQLLGGDLAFYKNFQDFVKRNKQAYACGDRLFSRETDEKGNIIGPMIEKAIYLEDDYVFSNSYESLKDLLMNSKDIKDVDKSILRYELERAKKVLKEYESICSTDGQSFRTIDSFKKIFEARGKWTDSMERAFRNIKEGKITAQDFLALWNPIKPFYFGYEAIDTNGRKDKVPVQHKNSEYMITALFSALNTALNTSPKLVGLHQFMVNHNVDVVHFHSVVKEGFNSPFSLEYNKAKYYKLLKEGKIILFGKKFKGTYKEYIDTIKEALKEGTISQKEFESLRGKFDFDNSTDVLKALESQCLDKKTGKLNPLMFKDFIMDNYMVVQPSDDHLIDADAILGTQLKNIIMADLPQNFSMTININGEDRTLNREESIKFYNTLLVDNLLDAFSVIGKEFSNIESLQRALFKKMEGNPMYGDDVKKALQLNEDKTGFVLPFNSPTLNNKIEQLVLSTFKDAIQRQKIKGGNSVLVSNFGLHNDLHVVYKDNDKSKGVDYIEAYLPASNSVMYQDFLEQQGDYQVINFKKMKETLGKQGAEELLDIIGYRIPTEDKYSIMPIRVVGFMPVEAGTTIMLPADIITMSGTDFDIDKLFLMTKEFQRIAYPESLYFEFKKYLEQRKGSESEADNMLRAMFGEESNVEEAISEGNQLYDKERRILKRRKEGYTDKEIDRLLEKSDLFYYFMEEKGFDMRYEQPKYKVLKPDTEVNGRKLSLNEISRQSHLSRGKRRAIRNNMIIDVIKQTLSNEEVSKLLMQPGNFDRVRHASRQQLILHDKNALLAFKEKYKDNIKKLGLYKTLQSMTTKQLEDFYTENATIVSPLAITDYLNMQKNLMDGNALIGIFAVNSSNHYKLQFLDLKINKDYKLMIDGKEISTIDSVYSPITGDRIGRINAEFQAAAPDNGKDPCLGDIGANPDTASRIGLLARIGLEPEMIGILNTCDDFVNYIKSTNTKPAINVSKFNLDFNELLEVLSNFRTLTREEFLAYIKESGKDTYLSNFLGFMSKIEDLSKSLNGVSKVSRVDSVNGSLAIDIPGVYQQYLGATDFMNIASSKSSPIIGLDKLVDITLDANLLDEDTLREHILNSTIPRLQAAYTLGIRSARTLCSELFPGLSDTVLETINLLRSETGKRLTSIINTNNVKILRKFISELTMAMLSYNSEFSTDKNSSIMDKRNYYIHDFPMKYYDFMNKKDDNGNYVHENIRRLEIFKRISNESEKGIKLTAVNGLSDKDRKHFTEELESLLWSDDQEVVNFLRDLFMYSYYDNGFQFSHNNFGILFTTAVLKNMPRFIESLNNSNADLLNGDLDIKNFVYQFLMNHPMLTRAMKPIHYQINGKELTLTKNGELAAASGVNRTGDLVMFIRADNRLWIKEGSYATGFYYTEVTNYNKTGIPYYDLNSNVFEIDYSKLQYRGLVGKVYDLEEKSKSNKNNKEEDPIDNTDTKDLKDIDELISSSIPKEEDDIPDYDPGEDEIEITEDDAPEDNDIDEDELELQANAFTQLDEALYQEALLAEELSEIISSKDEELDLDEYPDNDDPDNKACL